MPKSVGGSPAAVVRLATVRGNPDHPFAFSPANVTVPVGATVRWINDANVFHTVTSTKSITVRRPSGLFNKSLFRRGGTFQYTFRRPGTFHYYCQPHTEFMWGTVTVTP